MEKIKLEINIARDFSDAVGARDKQDGDFSGEEFFEKLLDPKISEAIKEKNKVFIDFDGTWGYPSSFISGSFGRLSKKHGEDVINYIEIKSEEDLLLEEEIKTAIKEGYDD